MSTKKPRSKALRIASNIVLLILLAILALPLYLTMRFSSPGSAPAQAKKVEHQARIFEPGVEVLIGEAGKGKWAVVAERATWERYLTLLRAKDELGLVELRLQNRLLSVEGGTRAKLIQRSGDLWEIRVLEGPWIGHSGWCTFEPFRWTSAASDPTLDAAVK